jgi:hypothetical protein
MQLIWLLPVAYLPVAISPNAIQPLPVAKLPKPRKSETIVEMIQGNNGAE